MKTLLAKSLIVTLVASAMLNASLRAEECAKKCKDGDSCIPSRECNENGATAYAVTDIVLVRPAGLAMTLVGGALYLVSWPVTAVSGDEHKAYCTLVKQPASYMFNRGWGEKCEGGKCDGDKCKKTKESSTTSSSSSSSKVYYTPRNQ